MNSDGERIKSNKRKIGVTEGNLARPEQLSPSNSVAPLNIMYRGYFPLWRKIRDWGWYKDSITKSVFLELLLLANFKEKDYLGHTIYPGQCVAGRKSLSASLGVSERQIRTALKRLLATKEITIKNCNKFSIITLNNFSKYTKSDQREVHQTTSDRPDIDQRSTTTYNDNKTNKTNNDNRRGFTPPTLESIISYFKEKKSTEAEANKFNDHFLSNGWVVGKAKAKMKDWRAASRKWIASSGEYAKGQSKTGVDIWYEQKKKAEADNDARGFLPDN